MPRRGCFNDLPENRIVVSPPPPIIETLFLFFSENNPVYRDRTHVPRCQKVTRLPLSYRGDRWDYNNATSKYGITFQIGTLSSTSFADADYASKATDRRSVSGGAILCGGASVCWFSRTQKRVTLSTSEAE